MQVVRVDDEGPPPRVDFDEFYRAQWPGAVRLAALLTQDSSAAEDVAQDAFSKIQPRWDGIENPAAYLRTTVVNTARRWIRRRITEREKLPMLLPTGVSEPEADHIADAIAALPYRYRAVVVMRYYADMSEAEIADALGCRPGAVKSLASRALAKLEKVIER